MRLHQIWLGGDIPARFKPWMEKWQQLHPTWEYKLWRDEDVPELRNQYLFDRAVEICPDNVGQFKADILRYELLYNYGGVYVDIDFEPQKPLVTLVSENDLWAAWEIEHRWINNAIIGSPMKHPFIGRLIDELEQSASVHAGSRPNVISGPQYLTYMYEKYKPTEFIIFPKEYFYPYLYNELHRGTQKFPDAYAVHHWNNKRVNPHAR